MGLDAGDKRKTDMEWKSYIVGLVDMLGQGRKLDELGSLWWKLQDSGNLLEDESKRMAELINGTYEEVERFRKLFTDTFDSMKNAIFNYPRMDTLLPGEQAVVKKIANGMCKLRSFSDLVIFYAPFDISDELITRAWISSMLSAYTCVSILEFRTGIFFRGGIEIGAGAELGNGDLYGPVLNKAHRLEKKVADYPRVVIGKKLSDFIQSEGQASDAGVFLNSALARAKDLCKGLVCQDDDGQVIVDYLGEKAVELNTFSDSKACSFVKEGKTKIEDLLNEYKKKGDQKLVERYKRLLAYYQSKMNFWFRK
jgi:hypothetical protein